VDLVEEEEVEEVVEVVVVEDHRVEQEVQDRAKQEAGPN